MSADPNWVKGYVPSADEWNSWWARKLDNTDPSVISGPYLPMGGGTLTGPLILDADPVNNFGAATKHYVDTHGGGSGGGVPSAPTDGQTYGLGGSTWIPVLPLTGGTLTGNLTAGTNTTSASLILNGPASTVNILQWSTAGLSRWRLQVDGAESTGNAGSSFRLFGFNDQGASLGEIMNISRTNGWVTWNNNPNFLDSRHTFTSASVVVSKTIGQSGTHTYTAGTAAAIGGASPAAIWQSVNWAGTADRTGQPALNFFAVNDTMQVNDLLAAQYQQFSLTYAYNAGASGGRSQMVLSMKKNASDPLGENYIQGLGVVTQVLKGDSYTPGVYRSRTSALNVDGRLGDVGCYFRSLLNCESDLRLEATNQCLWKGHWAFHWAIDDGTHGLEQDFGIQFDRSPAIAPGTGGGITLIQLGGVNSNWPLDPTRSDAAILQLKMPVGSITGVSPLTEAWDPRAGFGFDLWGMDFTTSPFRYVGLTIDGIGQIPTLGPGSVTYGDGTTLTLDVPNVAAVSAIVVNGGTHYYIGDTVLDTMGTLWKVASLVSVSSVGTVSLYKRGYAAATPTGPLTTSGGNGTGLTLNVTTIPTGFLVLNPTGSSTTIGKAGGLIGFNGAAAIARPTITGDRGGNSGLGSLLTQLSNFGLVVDSTTAGTASTGGVISFNTRTGVVTLTSIDVTDALGFVPYSVTNPQNYQTNVQVATSIAAVASTAPPLMNGTVAVGVSTLYTRQDHVHPVDTSRYSATNPASFQSDVQVAATVNTAVSTAVAAYVPLTQKAAALGVATLDNTGVVPTTQLPGAVTGTLTYLGGWNASTNTPVLASGALSGGVAQAAGRYYLVTVGATTAAIDGTTVWVAGDWASSNGTVWQRVQNSTSPYLPLTGGTLTASGTIAGIGGLTYTSSDSSQPSSPLIPDLVWSLADSFNGSVAVGLDKTGILNIAMANITALQADPVTAMQPVTKQYADGLRSNNTPQALGTANAGTSLTLARSDHVHPLQTFAGYAPVDSPVFTTSVTIDGDTWQPSVEPDIIWSLRGTGGNIPVWLDSTGTFAVAALTTTSLTGLTTLSATNATLTTATIATEVINDQAMPDLIGAVAGSNGNIVSGYDLLTGEFNVVSLNAGAVKVNGQPIGSGGSGGSSSALANTIDVRDPAYGAKGDASYNTGLVTTSGSTLTLINYHGTFSITAAPGVNMWTLTISNQRWDGWAFQPYHDGKLIYVVTDDTTFSVLARVVQHTHGSVCLITGTGITAQTSVTGSITCPGFDMSMTVAGKYITVDGMAKEVWGKFDLGTGAALGGRFFDPTAPYGVQTFISAIATVVSGNSITIANIVGSTPANGTFPMNWTSQPSLVQWGSNDIAPVANAARAAYDANKRSIAFTGDGNHYLMLGVCGSGQWLGQFIGTTTADTAPLLNGVYWVGDNVTTCAYTGGGGLYPHRVAAPRAKQPAIPFKSVSGRMHLPRCAAKPKTLPLNVLVTGDSLGTVNPQSQVSIAMGVLRFFEEFRRQNGSRLCNFYCCGMGGATWASLADPGVNVNNNTPAVIYGIIPKPVSGTFPHRNFYTNINQTGTGPAIEPDVIAIFNNTGNDRANIDIMSMQALINVIRNIPRADGYGPTDVLLQTDWNHVNFVYQLGTGPNTVMPDPHWGVWAGDYGYTANRYCAANRGFGCVDYAEVISRVSFANDLTRRALRQIPSVTWNLTPTAPVSIGPRCRDFALWFALPGANDAAAFAALTQIEFQLSMSAGNRLLIRNGPNGNIWLAVTTYGHFVDTPVTCTAGAKTVTVPAVTPITFTGSVLGKSTQIFCQTGVTFDATYEGKCFVAATGNLTTGVAGRRPQRNYLRRLLDANNMTTFDRTFDGGDIALAALPVSIGAQQFIPQDGEAMTTVSIIHPDGTLFSSQVAYGGYTSATQVTLLDNLPQTLSGTTVSLFLGRMCVPWFDTGLKPSATANIGMFEVNVSRGSLGFGYSPDLSAVPMIAPTVFRAIERPGGEFNCIVRARGTQQVVASNVWVDDDTPTVATCPPWELRGWFDTNSAGVNGGTVGHFGSRMRVEVLDPLYAIQDLSTG